MTGIVVFGFLLLILLALMLVWARVWGQALTSTLVIFPFFSILGILLHDSASPFFLPSDGQYYLDWSRALIDLWSKGTPTGFPQVWPGKGVWPVILATLGLLVGENVGVFGILLSAATVSMLSLVLEKTANVLGAKEAQWAILLIFFTSGPMLIFGPSLLREGIFWLGVSFGVLSLAVADRGHWIPSASYFVVSGAIMLAIRPDLGLILGTTMGGVIIMLWGIRSGLSLYLRLLFVPVLLAGLAYVFGQALDFLRPSIEPSVVDNLQASLDKESSTRFVQLDPSNDSDQSDAIGPELFRNEGVEVLCESQLVLKVACDGFLSLPRFIFGPFPWEFQAEPVWFFAVAATLHFLIILFLALTNVFVDQPRVWLNLGILVLALATAVVFASILTGYGILIRFRVVTEIILLPLAVKGLHTIRFQNSRIHR